MEEKSEKLTVRSVGIKFGLISGVISIVFFLVLALADLNPFDNKWGWIGAPISIIILFLAQKNFKDEGDGFMSYGQGMGITFWLGLISILVAGAFTYCYSNFIDTGVMDLFYEKQRADMAAKSMPDEQIEMAVTWTKKLYWPIYFFFGILFSLIIGLIVTIFTQKKNPEQVF